MAFLYDAKVRSFRLCREKWVWTNVFYFIPLKTNKIRSHIVLFPRADVDRSNDIPIESKPLSFLHEHQSGIITVGQFVHVLLKVIQQAYQITGCSATKPIIVDVARFVCIKNTERVIDIRYPSTEVITFFFFAKHLQLHTPSRLSVKAHGAVSIVLFKLSY